MHKMRLHTVLIVIFTCITLFGCNTTYHITTRSLLEQLATSKKDNKDSIKLIAPYQFFPGSVEGRTIKEIKCIDKDGETCLLGITKRTSIVFTDSGGSRKSIYFNTLLVQDSMMGSSRNHAFRTKNKPVKIADVATIEIER